MQAETTERGEEQEVIRWRCEQLTAAGFAPATAARLASDQGYDLHAVIELVELGCPAELAVRILAPLDAESAA